MNERPVPECEFRALAVGLGLDALEPSDEHLLRRHLPSCAACEKALAETHDVMAKIATDSVVEPAPTSLWESIAVELPAGAMDRLPPAPPKVPVQSGVVPRPRPISATRPRLVLAMAAALVAVLALGTWNVALQRESGRTGTVAAERAQVLRLLEQPDSRSVSLVAVDGAARGTMVMADDKAWLVLDGVEANDRSNSTFVLWGLSGAEAVPVTTFDLTQSGLDVVDLGAVPKALQGSTGVAVSLEKGRVAPASPSNRVATGTIA